MENFLIAGLGNPGAQYQQTRHNAGFMVLDSYAAAQGADFQPWQKLGEYAKISVAGKTVFLAKPMTYMNLSGQMVCHLARFYKIPASHWLICFDDMSLNLGETRLRVGIGPKPEFLNAADFVLSRFSNDQLPLLQTAVAKAADALDIFLKNGLEKAMNLFN